MAQVRRDPIIGRWVIVEEREKSFGPADYEKEPHMLKQGAVCQFCSGRESQTPPEVDAIRPGAYAPNAVGWLTRVVPNKFPALRIEGDLDRRGVGLYDMTNGVGAHEVLIETPDHSKNFADYSVEEAVNVIKLYQSRSASLSRDKRFKYIMIFKNYGQSAGASVEHAHSQIIATPVNPIRISRKLEAFREHFKRKERCLFCDLLQFERQDGSRIVRDEGGFVTFAPYASRFPFELMIAPRDHRFSFAELSRHEAESLAKALKDALLRVRLGLGDPPFNFVLHAEPNLHALPRRSGYWDTLRDDFHWQLIVYPRLTPVAGFEWGTGFYINSTPPEEAARHLRAVDVSDAALAAWRAARGPRRQPAGQAT